MTKVRDADKSQLGEGGLGRSVWKRLLPFLCRAGGESFGGGSWLRLGGSRGRSEATVGTEGRIGWRVQHPGESKLLEPGLGRGEDEAQAPGAGRTGITGPSPRGGSCRQETGMHGDPTTCMAHSPTSFKS